LAPVVLDALRPGDAVLVKGSLGSRMKKIVDALEASEPSAIEQPKDPR
jgi:UDP-N-acetylmuramoyl-tripeptide--D-alanyl-D-alanine ligase